MDNPALLLILFLAIAVMGAYYYLKRAQRRDVATTDTSTQVDPPAES